MHAGIDRSLRHAQAAQALLGSEIWSVVLRVENANRGSEYPRVVHALVFELAGILWFYCDHDGTQSLSLHRGRTSVDKQNLGPLLRSIDPGFRRFRIVEEETSHGIVPGELPNGCFLASVAAWQRQVDRGLSSGDARLLSYYPVARDARGHTVLTYSIGPSVIVIDPDRPDLPRTFASALADDPVRLARAYAGRESADRARFVPLPAPRDRPFITAVPAGSGAIRPS